MELQGQLQRPEVQMADKCWGSRAMFCSARHVDRQAAQLDRQSSGESEHACSKCRLLPLDVRQLQTLCSQVMGRHIAYTQSRGLQGRAATGRPQRKEMGQIKGCRETGGACAEEQHRRMSA